MTDMEWLDEILAEYNDIETPTDTAKICALTEIVFSSERFIARYADAKLRGIAIEFMMDVRNRIKGT